MGLLGGRLLPGHEVTFRIILTSIIQTPLLGLLKDHLFAALWTGYANLLKIRLCILTVRESGAGKELSMGAILYDHLAAASDTSSAILTDSSSCSAIFTASSRSG